MRLLRLEFSCCYFHFVFLVKIDNENNSMKAEIRPQKSHIWDCMEPRTSSSKAGLYEPSGVEPLRFYCRFFFFIFYFMFDSFLISGPLLKGRICSCRTKFLPQEYIFPGKKIGSYGHW